MVAAATVLGNSLQRRVACARAAPETSNEASQAFESAGRAGPPAGHSRQPCQLLELRADSGFGQDVDPYQQFVWSLRYIDAPVLMDLDSNTDGDYDDTADGTDDNLYFLNDANMNVTALVKTDGTVAERYVYDAYGSPTIYNAGWSSQVTWANSRTNDILYCGYRLDAETGLFHVRHRAYHPALGRWMQRDRLRYWAGDRDLYGYVNGRPGSRQDPLGLWEFDPLEPLWREIRAVQNIINGWRRRGENAVDVASCAAVGALVPVADALDAAAEQLDGVSAGMPPAPVVPILIWQR